MRDCVILQSGSALELGNHTFTNLASHLSAPLLLDVDLMAQIEVSIVCTEKLVCTWYVLDEVLVSQATPDGPITRCSQIFFLISPTT